jgi:hypothetical protein
MWDKLIEAARRPRMLAERTRFNTLLSRMAPRVSADNPSILDTAIWGAELAAGDGPERIDLVEPTGEIVDDPNLTDQRFPGNLTRFHRFRDPLRVVGEVVKWKGHPPEQLLQMRNNVKRARMEGAKIID